MVRQNKMVWYKWLVCTALHSTEGKHSGPFAANKRGISEQCLQVTEAENKDSCFVKFNVMCTFGISLSIRLSI